MHSRSRRCDLSGQWVPVLAAAAIVMIITAASMFSASECLSSTPAFIALMSFHNLTKLDKYIKAEVCALCYSRSSHQCEGMMIITSAAKVSINMPSCTQALSICQLAARALVISGSMR